MKTLQRIFILFSLLLVVYLPADAFAAPQSTDAAPPVVADPGADGASKATTTTSEDADKARAEASTEDADKAKTETQETAVDPGTMTVTWNNGLRMRSADNRFEMRFFGRLMLDSTWISEDQPFDGVLGKVEDGFEVRRGRMGVSGYLYDNIEYKFEVDFAGGSVGGTDMYIGLRNLPITARLGHQKEPFSLQQMGSSRYLVFMERAVTDMFAPARNMGLLFEDTFAGGKGTWAAGAFRDTASNGWDATPGNNYNVTGRVTYAPILEDGGRKLLHLGAQVNQRVVDGNLRLSTRPGDHNAPNIIVVNIPATSATFTNLEAATTIGPVGVQGEYNTVWVKSAERGDPTLRGGYIQAHVFLTGGDFRAYRGGAFGQFRPQRNFLEGGPGAIQLAARWARVDVEEALEASTPGKLSVFTVGANWWWNPHVRWRLNYEVAKLDKVQDDTAHIFHWRASIDW